MFFFVVLRLRVVSPCDGLVADYPTPPGKTSYKRPSSAPSETYAYGTGFTHTDRVLKSGWLLKAFGGVSLRTWKRRWVRLSEFSSLQSSEIEAHIPSSLETYTQLA
jgi:hypothetical protein